MNSSPNAEGQKPEPKEDVNFLIDDVDREHTESVLVFNCARRTIVVESAFGHLKMIKNYNFDPNIHKTEHAIHSLVLCVGNPEYMKLGFALIHYVDKASRPINVMKH